MDGALLEHRLKTCGRVREDIDDNHEILPGGSGAKVNISSLQEAYCGSLRSGVKKRRMRIDEAELLVSGILEVFKYSHQRKG